MRFSRARLLKGSVIGLGALLGSAAGAAELVASSGSQRSAERDREILKSALLIERLQAAFYAEALRVGSLSGELRQFAQVVGAQEQAHVKYVSGAIGAAVTKAPSFHFGSATRDSSKFITTAVTLEDTGLAAYNGQAGNLTPQGLAAAARVVSVEARHAGWARALAGRDPAPTASDVPITLTEATAALQPFLA